MSSLESGQVRVPGIATGEEPARAAPEPTNPRRWAHPAVRSVLELAARGSSPDERDAAVRHLGASGAPPTPADVVRSLLAGSRNPRAPGHPAGADALAAALRALGAVVLVPDLPEWPARLASAWPEHAPPLWLFVRAPEGRLAEGPTAAVVGTRRPSLDGLRTARSIAARLAAAGAVVVSGMARGIDQAAHEGALEAGGLTIGVVGTGLDVDYPRGARGLKEAVAASGGLVSELPCGALPRPHHFPARNRIVAGLADVVVVVEGRARSGALHTARLAGTYGRDVMAVPGPLSAATSQAPLDLIRDGAMVVTRVEDVLEVLGLSARTDEAPRPATMSRLGSDAAAVQRLLGAAPAQPDELALAAGLPVGRVLAALSELGGLGLAVATPRGVVAAR